MIQFSTLYGEEVCYDNFAIEKILITSYFNFTVQGLKQGDFRLHK